MKISEAEKRWCPWASSRVIKRPLRDDEERDSCDHNLKIAVYDTQGFTTCCISDGCMAWVVDDNESSHHCSNKDCLICEKKKVAVKAEGHCGMVAR